MPRGLPVKGWRRKAGKLDAKTLSTILEAIRRDRIPESHACAKAGIDRTTWYRWKKEFPELADQVQIAEDEAIADAFAELRSASQDRNSRTGVRDNWTAIARWLEARSPFFAKAPDQLEGKVEHVHRIEYVDSDANRNPFLEAASSAQGTGDVPSEAGVAELEDPDGRVR